MKKSVLLVLLALIVNISIAQNIYKLHSVFIYTFTRYIVWPEAYNKGDFEILVMGDSPIIEELNEMARVKKVGDRSIKIVKISSASEIRKCNILFVPASKSAQINDVLAKVTNQSILVVTEEPGMGTKGSDINFIMKNGKTEFELNQAATNKKNLKIANELSRHAIMI